MTQSYEANSTPTNLQTELSLEDEVSYSIQVTGVVPVFYSESASAPARTDNVHALAPGTWKVMTIDSTNPPWIWTDVRPSRVAVTRAS